MSKPILLAFGGRSGAGKSEAIRQMKRILELCTTRHVETLAFSDPLKAMLNVGLSDFDIHMEDRMAIIPELGVTRRGLEQKLGTEFGRDLVHPDLWVKIAAKRILSAKNRGAIVLLDGVRFPNEVAMIKAFEGQLLYIDRPYVTPVHEHISESYDVHEHCDRTIYNNGDKKDLQASLRCYVDDSEYLYEALKDRG